MNLSTEEKFEKMKEIRDEIIGLKESSLYDYRIQNGNLPVIGEGDHDASIMFVGEAPGKNEAKTGRPFCGASGRIFDELLTFISIDRKKVYVTNIVKDRPPENRDPLPEEISLYGPFLERQIALIQPKILVGLGRFSSVYVMNLIGLSADVKPISQMHGEIFKGAFQGKEMTCIPLYHPAVAIYNIHEKETLKKDFEALKSYI
ncbi:MAG: uracil-DNA glycosylase [Patescibacteria group bacterium]